MAMSEKLKAAIQQWRLPWQKRRHDRRERDVTARENMRYPTRNDVPTGQPNIGL
jgi:hypothetical protein